MLNMVDIINSTTSNGGLISVSKLIASGVDNQTFNSLSSSLIIPRIENYTTSFNITR